ncbi:hypothetical protein [Pseudopelagicola sp. nBUS_19]|uniref:hypothetical protein n=1 Tax=Pseudopelagicola sp. nBUS_19 TaxID=3395316 RepID=UPI003EB85656
MNEETLSDAIERAKETFPQLWEVGEKQDYLGGFKLYNGPLKYRRMSHEVGIPFRKRRFSCRFKTTAVPPALNLKTV